jgi:copper homeostasis protein
MTLEVCVDSFEGAQLAERFGANRIELCSGLSVGGLTPSNGLTAKCAEIIELHAILRNREGDFVYSPRSIKIMLDDIDSFAQSGANGIVFGCLTGQNQIDIEANTTLVQEAKILGLETTFHRAFDYCKDPKKSLETIIDLGFDRLLTSGKQPTAIEGIELIRKLVSWADGRIEIMAGSGVNASNALELIEAGVDAIHFTSHTFANSKDSFGMGSKSIPDEEKIASIIRLFQ